MYECVDCGKHELGTYHNGEPAVYEGRRVVFHNNYLNPLFSTWHRFVDGVYRKLERLPGGTLVVAREGTLRDVYAEEQAQSDSEMARYFRAHPEANKD